ncbi:SAV_915 family protein [Haloechinothrix sp. LS1_15]|uniref:SAV_915 family protein n=1 Tax=Haloechinothrix sp. LS1_15 TaxID=2652248 RepID=UPI002946594D|nr:SAV_915 family protein [Haloechinothrix sp. LS1_15]MDV6013455.1 hypothetical protein [Haloechinothrix sp. LS1_15]
MSSRWDSDFFGPPEGETILPEVITGDMVAGEDDDIPPVVWTPTATAWDEGDNLRLVLRQLDTAEQALLVFTSLEKLAEGCGLEQPYVSIRTEWLEQLRYTAGADRILWDAVLAPEIRQYGEYRRDSGDGQ